MQNEKEKGVKKIPLQMGFAGKGILIAAGIILAFALCMMYLEISPWEAVTGFPEFIGFFITKFLPPTFENIMQYIPSVFDTVLFAIVGTYLSAFLAFVCGLLMNEKTNHIAPLRIAVRGIISFLRNIPVLIWASILVYIFGVGEIVGLIALVIATLGFLARSYAESIDEIAGSRLEALEASGASYWQVLWHGLIPEFVPSWINWTLFSFEINIRASAILGMVGAGGIGVLVQTNLKLFQYQEACAIIIIIIGIVLLTEAVTNKARKLIH